MQKVKYLCLTIGLALLILIGCKKTEVDMQDDEEESAITTQISDNASITEKVVKDENQIVAEDKDHKAVKDINQKEDEVDADSEEITNQPDYLFNYKTPNKFSKNIFDYIIKVDGDFYQLPAPVKAFIDNGWIFEEDIPDKMLQAANDIEKLIMTRAGKRILVRLANFDTKEHNYIDCAVVSVKGGNKIIETSFSYETIPGNSSLVDDYTDEEGIHYTNYAIKDYLYCFQGYFFEYINNQLSNVEVSYYYEVPDRGKRKQTLLMDWEKDKVSTPENIELLFLDTDTVYQIDIDNDKKTDQIDVKTFGTKNDMDVEFTIIINGEPSLVYEDYYYFERAALLKAADGRYLLAMCYGGVNDHEKTDLFLIENNHIRMTATIYEGIETYSGQLLITKDFAEFDGFSEYVNTYILSNDGKLSQQGDSILNHTHIAAFDFNAYLYNAQTDQYQITLINKGTIVTLLHTDWNTVWIELDNGIQGYFIADDFDVWGCFSGEEDYNDEISEN